MVTVPRMQANRNTIKNILSITIAMNFQFSFTCFAAEVVEVSLQLGRFYTDEHLATYTFEFV